MGPVGGKADQPFAMEHRTDERNVRQMTPSAIGIVHKIDITLLDGFRSEIGDRKFHSQGHGREMARIEVRRGDQLGLWIDDGAGKVTALDE